MLEQSYKLTLEKICVQKDGHKYRPTLGRIKTNIGNPPMQVLATNLASGGFFFSAAPEK
jgi:hypothetical protein